LWDAHVDVLPQLCYSLAYQRAGTRQGSVGAGTPARQMTEPMTHASAFQPPPPDPAADLGAFVAELTLPRYAIVLIDEGQFFAPIHFEIITVTLSSVT